MSDPVEIRLRPREDGKWFWFRTDDAADLGEPYDTRAEALAAAREHNGRSVSEVFNSKGEPVGQAVVDGELRIVLLRTDGSFYAEIDAPAGDVPMPKRARVSVTPAESSAEAEDVSVDG